MSRPQLIVVARGTLDVDAARRLADYGDLDDAGVTRALEQVHVQRWGRWDLPDHLHRVIELAAVCVERGTVRLGRWSGQDEHAILAGYHAFAPGVRADLVDWDGTTGGWLLARAAAHDLVTPRALVRATHGAIVDAFASIAADHPAGPSDFEADCRRLFDGAAPNEPPDALSRVRSRARLWWRACHARGELVSEQRRRMVEQLALREPE